MLWLNEIIFLARVRELLRTWLSLEFLRWIRWRDLNSGDNKYYAALENDFLQPLQIFSKVPALSFKVLLNEPRITAMTVYLGVSSLINRLDRFCVNLVGAVLLRVPVSPL